MILRAPPHGSDPCSDSLYFTQRRSGFEVRSGPRPDGLSLPSPPYSPPNATLSLTNFADRTVESRAFPHPSLASSPRLPHPRLPRSLLSFPFHPSPPRKKRNSRRLTHQGFWFISSSIVTRERDQLRTLVRQLEGEILSLRHPEAIPLHFEKLEHTTPLFLRFPAHSALAHSPTRFFL